MHFFPLNEQLDVYLYCNCHKMVFYKAGKKKKRTSGSHWCCNFVF